MTTEEVFAAKNLVKLKWSDTAEINEVITTLLSSFSLITRYICEYFLLRSVSLLQSIFFNFTPMKKFKVVNYSESYLNRPRKIII